LRKGERKRAQAGRAKEGIGCISNQQLLIMACCTGAVRRRGGAGGGSDLLGRVALPRRSLYTPLRGRVSLPLYPHSSSSLRPLPLPSQRDMTGASDIPQTGLRRVKQKKQGIAAVSLLPSLPPSLPLSLPLSLPPSLGLSACVLLFSPHLAHCSPIQQLGNRLSVTSCNRFLPAPLQIGSKPLQKIHATSHHGSVRAQGVGLTV